MYRITEWAKNAISRKNKLLFKNSLRYYTNETSIPPSKSSTIKKLIYTSGVTIALVGGITSYARYDQKFGQKLNEFVPGSDAFIKFIYQEEKTYMDDMKRSVSSTSENVVSNVYKLIGKEKPEETRSSVNAPPSLIKTPTPIQKTSNEKTKVKETSVVSEKFKKENDHEEIRSNNIGTKVKETSVVSEKFKKGNDHEEIRSNNIDNPTNVLERSENFQKYDVVQLKQRVIDAIKEAVIAYNNATEELRNYKKEVIDLIEKSAQNEDHSVWFKIKEKTDSKKEIIKKAETNGEIAMKEIEYLKLLINDSKGDLDHIIKDEIEENINAMLSDLVYTKATFLQEQTESSVADNFSRKVEKSRKMLSKELGLLFPSLLADSTVAVTEEELDLFVIYTCQLISLYQKEINKLETVNKSKINKIIEQSKIGNQEIIKEMVDLETENLKRDFAQELIKQELKLKLDYEKQLVKSLQRQAEVHYDHLNEVILLKEKETERKRKQEVDQNVENMQIAYNRQLAKIIGRMKGLDSALKEKAISEKQAKRSQLLWSACQSLMLSIKSGTNLKPWEEQLKPLENEITAISKAAAEEDAFVKIIISNIPNEAISRGVFSELALKDRFLNVEKIAYRVANLPEGFSSLPAIFLSYLQSFLLIQFSKPIPTAELVNEPFDVSSLNNYDILCRARYWLDRGDFIQTLKYMNLLKGAARSISEEWIKETRIFLETQQAVNVLLSHAVYSNLNYLKD